MDFAAKAEPDGAGEPDESCQHDEWNRPANEMIVCAEPVENSPGDPA